MRCPAVLMILAVAVAALLVPETSGRRLGRVDWAGAGLLSLGLVLLLAAIGNGSTWGWAGARTIGAISGGCAALAMWIALERRVAHPFVDLSLVSREGLGLLMLTGFFFGAELLGSTAANVLFLGRPRVPGSARPRPRTARARAARARHLRVRRHLAGTPSRRAPREPFDGDPRSDVDVDDDGLSADGPGARPG